MEDDMKVKPDTIYVLYRPYEEAAYKYSVVRAEYDLNDVHVGWLDVDNKPTHNYVDDEVQMLDLNNFQRIG
jgi:hypothetical protein